MALLWPGRPLLKGSSGSGSARCIFNGLSSIKITPILSCSFRLGIDWFSSCCAVIALQPDTGIEWFWTTDSVIERTPGRTLRRICLLHFSWVLNLPTKTEASLASQLASPQTKRQHPEAPPGSSATGKDVRLPVRDPSPYMRDHLRLSTLFYQDLVLQAQLQCDSAAGGIWRVSWDISYWPSCGKPCGPSHLRMGPWQSRGHRSPFNFPFTFPACFL